MPRERNEPASIERALKQAATLTHEDVGKIVEHLAGPQQPPKSLAAMAYVETTYAECSGEGKRYLHTMLKKLHAVLTPKPATPEEVTPS